MELSNTVTQIHPSQRAILPDNPTVTEAVEYMQTSMDMLDWNLKRSRVRRAVGTQLFIDLGYCQEIDCVGLCSSTLKRAKITNTYHIPFVAANSIENNG